MPLDPGNPASPYNNNHTLVKHEDIYKSNTPLCSHLYCEHVTSAGAHLLPIQACNPGQSRHSLGVRKQFIIRSTHLAQKHGMSV